MLPRLVMTPEITRSGCHGEPLRASIIPSLPPCRSMCEPLPALPARASIVLLAHPAADAIAKTRRGFGLTFVDMLPAPPASPARTR